MTRPISRVLSSTAIYLDLSSPTGSSRHNFSIRRANVNDTKFQIDVASGKVCIAVQLPVLWYALTAPFHHHLTNEAVYFCCTISGVTSGCR